MIFLYSISFSILHLDNILPTEKVYNQYLSLIPKDHQIHQQVCPRYKHSNHLDFLRKTWLQNNTWLLSQIKQILLLMELNILIVFFLLKYSSTFSTQPHNKSNSFLKQLWGVSN